MYSKNSNLVCSCRREKASYIFTVRELIAHSVFGGSKLNDHRSGMTWMLHITCHADDPVDC